MSQKFFLTWYSKKIQRLQTHPVYSVILSGLISFILTKRKSKFPLHYRVIIHRRHGWKEESMQIQRDVQALNQGILQPVSTTIVKVCHDFNFCKPAACSSLTWEPWVIHCVIWLTQWVYTGFRNLDPIFKWLHQPCTVCPRSSNTECPNIYRRSLLHLLNYWFAVYLSRCSTD